MDNQEVKLCPFCAGNSYLLQDSCFNTTRFRCPDCKAITIIEKPFSEAVSIYNARINPLDIPPKHGDIDALYEEDTKEVL